MSSLRVGHANSSVVGCKNQHKCLYSVPATEQQKRQWLHFIFYNNVPDAVCVSLYVSANHFTSDCFSNKGQHKANPTIRDPATASEPPISVAAVW